MNKKESKILLILFTVLLLGCAVFYGTYFLKLRDKQKQSGTPWVYVQYGDEIVGKYNIKEDGVYEFTGNYGKFNLEIRDERYHAVNVDCPDHTCEGFGWVGIGGITTIACLPNDIIVYQ